MKAKRRAKEILCSGDSGKVCIVYVPIPDSDLVKLPPGKSFTNWWQTCNNLTYQEYGLHHSDPKASLTEDALNLNFQKK